MLCGSAPRVGLGVKLAAWYSILLLLAICHYIVLFIYYTAAASDAYLAALSDNQVMEILENLVSGRGAGDMRQIAVIYHTAPRLAFSKKAAVFSV